jgi:hypothetical protein
MPAKRQARKEQGAAECRRKPQAAKVAKEKVEEPAKDKTHKRKAKKRKLTGSVPDYENEVAVNSGSEDEEDGPEQSMPFEARLKSWNISC